MKISAILLTLFVTALAHANIIFVTPNGSGGYYTILSAYNASVAGDTILIGPGSYNEAITSINRKLHIIAAGFDVTSVVRFTFNSGGSQSTVEGIRFIQTSNDPIIFSSSDSVTVRRCMMSNTGLWASLIGPANGRMYVEDCIFMRNYTGSGLDLVSVSTGGRSYFRNCLFTNYNPATNQNAIDGTTTRTEFHNCTFLGFNDVFNMSTTEPSVFINNLFYDWGGSPSWGTVHPGSVWDYNGATNMTPPGSHALLLPGNPFVSYVDSVNFIYGTSNLRIAPASPAFNGGHPDILDLDGSISDLGIYGGSTPIVDTGAPAYPFAITVATTPATALVGTNVDLNSIGRIGPQY